MTNKKIPWNKGKKNVYSEEIKLKMVETRRKNGSLKHDENYKNKMREMMTGKNNPMYGKKRPDVAYRLINNNPMHNPLTAKKLSETMIKNYESGKRKKIMPPMWNKGISGKPYWKRDYKGFTDSFKEAIKIRDYCCMICGSSNNLQVHHIDYNKINTIKENCLALCNPCHGKTGTNRQHWKIFFQSMLAERYGYKYSEDGKVIIELKADTLPRGESIS